MTLNRKQAQDLVWAFEGVALAVDKCRLRKPQRKLVDEKISQFRQTFIRLADTKKQQKNNNGYGK